MISDLGQNGDLDWKNKDVDVDMRDKDKELKDKGKEYADEKRKAKKCELVQGDKVIMKNMTKDNKLSTPFGPTALTEKR